MVSTKGYSKSLFTFLWFIYMWQFIAKVHCIHTKQKVKVIIKKWKSDFMRPVALSHSMIVDNIPNRKLLSWFQLQKNVIYNNTYAAKSHKSQLLALWSPDIEFLKRIHFYDQEIHNFTKKIFLFCEFEMCVTGYRRSISWYGIMGKSKHWYQF